jgi:hypothetical protein
MGWRGKSLTCCVSSGIPGPSRPAGPLDTGLAMMRK